MKLMSLFISCLIFLTACGPREHNDQDHGENGEHSHTEGLMIYNAYVKPSIPGTQHTAAYFAAMSGLEHDIVLVNVTSDAAERVEIHEHTMIDGLMKMRKIEMLDIPKSSTTLLKPGGHHLMLMDLKQPIEEGQSIDITLLFNTGEQKTISVKAVNKPELEHHHHGDDDY